MSHKQHGRQLAERYSISHMFNLEAFILVLCVRESNAGALKEQPVLFSTVASLKAFDLIFKSIFGCWVLKVFNFGQIFITHQLLR